MPSAPITPKFFGTAAAFRRWLERNHDRADELWLGFYRKSAGKRGITYPEAVDQALCFGWIDGIRKSLDDGSYTNRFTPRRQGSVWSAVNIRRMAALKAAGLLHAAGERAFAARDPAKTNLYSFEREHAVLTKAQERQFRENAAAWSFFQSQPPGYRRTATHWVTSAKQEATRARRLATLIADSAAGLRIRELRR